MTPNWFYVGGAYVETTRGTFLRDQMYVECYEPQVKTRSTPVVMFHGGVQTATNFVATPDGRRGWLGDFLEAGYVVYLVDQPERGRSGHWVDGKYSQALQRYSAERIEQIFTAPAGDGRWPLAHKHSQWPGSGKRGDPVFDQYYASQVEMLVDRTQIERLSRDAGIALLERIGPSILLTHSQSGPFGWLLADACPQLVAAVVAVEPNGPPFKDVQLVGPPDWFRYNESLARPYGITRLALEFDPPVVETSELAPSDVDAAQPGYKQVAPILPTGITRRLPNLESIPIAIVSAEASFHGCYDQCTSAFLHWADVDHDFVPLAEHGIYGNGHMMMLEKNGAEIAKLIIAWLARRTS